MFDGHTTIVNNSSYTVSFEWGGKTETIEPNKSTTINYTYVKITNLNPNKRVVINYIDDNNRDITDLPSYEVRVENLSSETLTLKANGWLGNDMENIIIGEYIDDITQKGRIYTKSPKFTVSGNLFPVTVLHQFINDICYVKIF